MYSRATRTSRTDPLRIAEVWVGPSHGLIGITFAPGKRQLDGISGAWDRDVEVDLDRIAAWNAAAVVTLVEHHELDALQIGNIGAEVQRRHMEWHHWPIADVSVPCSPFEANWERQSQSLLRLLQGGSNVLIHCKGGLGRAGMCAARLLVHLGVNPPEAVKR